MADRDDRTLADLRAAVDAADIVPADAAERYRRTVDGLAAQDERMARAYLRAVLRRGPAMFDRTAADDSDTTLPCPCGATIAARTDTQPDRVEQSATCPSCHRVIADVRPR